MHESIVTATTTFELPVITNQTEITTTLIEGNDTRNNETETTTDNGMFKNLVFNGNVCSELP